LNEQEKKTHLYRFHAQNGKIVAFAGFEMPISYKGIIPEHMAVRNGVGIFDVTHMGRVTITGADAKAFLNYVTTNDVSKLEILSAHYSTMCNEKGGIKDDFVLSRQEENRFFMVYNAANRTKNYQWLTKQTHRFNVKVEDVSDNIAMFAVQGPKAQEALQKIATEELSAGKEFNVEPCGLGARDTLRLEAGMCLYGSDIDENTTPLEARISFAVKLEKGDFIGKEALLEQKAQGVKKKRVGLKMLEKGIPRPKHEVFKDEKKIGYITSGTFSPLLKQGIAMAYVQTEHAVVGEVVYVKIRDKQAKAEIIKFPFYDPNQYGHTRKQ